MEWFMFAVVLDYMIIRVCLMIEQIEAINDVREAIDDIAYVEGVKLEKMTRKGRKNGRKCNHKSECNFKVCGEHKEAEK